MSDTDAPKPSEASSEGARRNWRDLLLRPSAKYSLLTLLAGGFIGGIVFWGGFNTAMEATNTMTFCIGCHEMRENVYKEYRTTIHYQNRTGVQATCSDCHVPDPWIHKMVRKVQASNELWHWALGSIDTPQKFDAKRLQLASNVWASMKATDSRECRNCHTLESMNPEFQRPRARKVHMDAFQSGNTCIDCHKGIAHKGVRHLVPEAQLEAMEAPKPQFARAIPQTYVDGLKRITDREAQEAQKRQQEQAAAEAAVKARVDQAVKQALATAQAAPAPAAGAGTATVGSAQVAQAAAPAAANPAGAGIDWASVPARTINIFFPGQASWEWVLTGRDHGGARSFIRSGDNCSTCHAKETKDIGSKVTAGDHKAEPAPIKGKRPHIDVAVRAAHDGTHLYLRAEWADAPHVPAPGADGGKMDPKNQSKFALMIAGAGIDKVEQAGCWATCHSDSRSMPDAKKVDPSKIPALVQDADLKEGLTKYIAESRTAMDLRGEDAPRGGGDKVKAAADLEALLKAGTFMDLMRVNSGGAAENGHVLGQRIMSGGAPVEGAVKLEGGTWVATLKRPLKSDKPGDVSLEAGKTYVAGFAIHDDHANARFHHVSLDLRLALDNAEADINVVKK